jgi:hypothetical protein
MHTAKPLAPEPIPFEVKIAIGKFFLTQFT